MTTLLSSLDVIQKTIISKDFPVSKLCPIIEDSEEAIFENCALGYDFYEALKEKLVPIPAKIPRWQPNTSYALDAIVMYYDNLIKSTEASNSSDPCSSETWVMVDKFTEECLNIFWKKLSSFLANRLLAENLTLLTYNFGGKGLTKFSEDFRNQSSGLITVERGERVDMASSFAKKADRQYENILKHIERHGETCEVLQASEWYKNTCLDNCKTNRKSRRLFTSNSTKKWT